MKNSLLTIVVLALFSCNKDTGINPALTGSWSPIAIADQTGVWKDVSPGYGTTLVFGKNGSVSGVIGCGCVYAQTYRQKEYQIEFTFGGTPCPTLIACLPEPETKIVSLTANELVLKRGQYQTRYARK